MDVYTKVSTPIPLNDTPRWEEFARRFMDWKKKHKNLNLPFELDEPNRCINIGMSDHQVQLSRRFNQWNKAIHEFEFKIAPRPIQGFQRYQGYLYNKTDYESEIDRVRSRENARIRVAQEAFALTYSKPTINRSLDFNTRTSLSIAHSQDLIQKIGENEQIKFIIIGEDHNDPASWLWLNKHKYALVNAGVTAIAMEFYGIWQQNDLDSFYSSETNDAPPAEATPTEAIFWNSFLSKKPLMLETLKQAGIRGIGIETEATVNANGRAVDDKTHRIETLDRTTPFALNEQGLLNASTGITILWVGQLHTQGVATWLGKDRCLTIDIVAAPTQNHDELTDHFDITLLINDKYSITETIDHSDLALICRTPC